MITLGLLVAIGSAITAPLASAAPSFPCCPETGQANAPCKTIVQSTSTGTPSAELRSILAPLRRRQSPSDAIPPEYPGIPAEGIYVRFIRRAAVIDGSTFYLVPVAHACESGFLGHETLFLLPVGGHSEAAPAARRQHGSSSTGVF
jgi:hypothetical protein